MSCPSCAKRRLIDIGVTIGDETITMHSCSHCGTRWWEREGGESLALPEVLELASANR